MPTQRAWGLRRDDRYGNHLMWEDGIRPYLFYRKREAVAYADTVLKIRSKPVRVVVKLTERKW